MDDSCFLCAGHGYPLCRACAHRITQYPLYSPVSPQLPYVRALGVYSASWRKLVLALKHDRWLRNSQLPLQLGEAMGRAIASGLRDEYWRNTGSPYPPRVLNVIPAPASWKRRHHPLTRKFALGIAAGISQDPAFQRVQMRASLRLPPGTGTQAGRTSSERARARRGQFRVSRLCAGAALLVDDVVTTGGTLQAMAETLQEQQVRVFGACVLATARIPDGPAAIGNGTQVGKNFPTERDVQHYRV